jgi:zinc transporter ZupT
MDITFIVMGLLGGIIRGLVGFTKYLTSYKGVKFNWAYFGITVGVSGLVGGISGWIFNGIMGADAMNQFYAFIAGYAGGDFLENSFRVLFKQPTMFKLPQILEDSLNKSTK